MTIVRGQRALVFPTAFMLVAATNPCPCGFAGVGDRCSCGEAELRRHRRRLSGPLLDRMDLLVNVDRPTEQELRSSRSRRRLGPASCSLTPASASARRLRGTGASCNGEMDARLVRRHVQLDEAAERALARAYAVGALSARGRHRVLRVARTIADLERRERVTHDDVLTALGLRQHGETWRERARATTACAGHGCSGGWPATSRTPGRGSTRSWSWPTTS